jgi:hypothetical protein
VEQQRTLDQAVNEKRSKIGEVEILRANLQKVRPSAHSHRPRTPTRSARPPRRTVKRRQNYARRRRVSKPPKSQRRKTKKRNSSVCVHSSSSSRSKWSLRARPCPAHQHHRPHKLLHPPSSRVGTYQVPPVASAALPWRKARLPTAKSALPQARQRRSTSCCPVSSTTLLYRLRRRARG